MERYYENEVLLRIQKLKHCIERLTGAEKLHYSKRHYAVAFLAGHRAGYTGEKLTNEHLKYKTKYETQGFLRGLINGRDVFADEKFYRSFPNAMAQQFDVLKQMLLAAPHRGAGRPKEKGVKVNAKEKV